MGSSTTKAKQRALFTLEIGICLVFVVAMAVLVAILWSQFTEGEPTTTDKT